jgi:RNA polymerase sigma-70 factor (ECF subfamily)
MRLRIRPPAQDEEARLMQRAAHQPHLFAPIYERYFARVYGFCLRRVESEQDAEDLCSQVFARALSGLHTYRGGEVAPWLFAIARNVLIDHYRRRRATVPLDDQFSDDDTAIARADDDLTLHSLLARLPDAQRELLALLIDGGLTSEQAGALLGKSPVSIRVQLHRIIHTLRRAARLPEETT